jgi:hypothetical protein
MDVVGHDYKSVQGVEPQFLFTEMDGVRHAAGNARIFQPQRACAGFVQHGIQQLEFPPRRILGKRGFGGTANPGCAFWRRWQRTIQSPCQEDGGAIRMPVGKIAAVEGHWAPGLFSALVFLNSTERAQLGFIARQMRERWGRGGCATRTDRMESAPQAVWWVRRGDTRIRGKCGGRKKDCPEGQAKAGRKQGEARLQSLK